jgi:hypothetical protein
LNTKEAIIKATAQFYTSNENKFTEGQDLKSTVMNIGFVVF